MSYTGEAAFSEGDEVCAAISSQAAGTGGCLTEAAAVCGDGVLDGGEECDDGNVVGGDGCGADCAVECGYTCHHLAGLPTTGTGVAGTEAAGAVGASVCALGCGNGVVDHALGETCDVGGAGAEAGLACCVGCVLSPGASCCGGECCDAEGAPRPTATLCAGGAGHCSGDGACELSSEMCDRYANMAFAPSECPVTNQASCRPHCVLQHASGPNTCHHPPVVVVDLIAAPWSAFADGTACLAADGRSGECARGACLARSTCGDGVLDPSPDPDPDPNPYPNPNSNLNLT